MTYSAIHKKFIISEKELERASYLLLWSMKKARLLAGVTLGKRQSKGLLTDLDHLEKAIIDSAKEIGIDFGVDWGNELDLTDIN